MTHRARRLLLVDDSPFILNALRTLLAESGDLEVAAAVTTGAAAIAYLRENAVDAVVLDLHMLDMDGAETARCIMEASPTPILMLTSAERNDPGIIRALEAGAVDMLQKPGRNPRSPFLREVRDQLFDKIRQVAKAKVRRNAKPATTPEADAPPALPRKPALVVVGISTGGPGALGRVLPRLTPRLGVPVLIVQHIADGYTVDLARALQLKCCVPVREAVQQEPLQPGTVVLAPSNRHLEIDPSCRLRLGDGAPRNGFRPSVDVLFLSAAKHFPRPILALLMTGMGDDGLAGCRELKRRGHHVIIQDRDSSVVWGMPGEVHKAGCFDRMLSLESIGAMLHCL